MTEQRKSAATRDREARLQRALRENLKRRKAQARGRADDAAPGSAADPPSHDSAGIATDNDTQERPGSAGTPRGRSG